MSNQSFTSVLIADDAALAVDLAQAGYAVQVTAGGGAEDFDLVRACQCRDVCVDVRQGMVLRRDSAINLTFNELQLLRYLMRRRGTIVSRDELLRVVRGYRGNLTRTVDVDVAWLRQKLEDATH